MEKKYTDKLTIAIPCYERYEYFEDAINSAINQTMRCNIIVVDNASSHSKFKDYVESLNDKNIIYFRNENNIGMFGNWNKCYLYSKTEYVMILGDDDILMSNFVDEFQKAINLYDVDIYFTNFAFLRDNAIVDNKYKLVFGSSDIGKIKKNGCVEGLSFPTISQCTKRQMMISKPFMENPHGSNDWLHIYTLDDNIKVYGNNKVLVHYRIHNLNDSSVNVVITLASIPVIYWKLYKYYILDDRLLAMSAKKNAFKIIIKSIIKGNIKFRNYLKQDNYYVSYYHDIIFSEYKVLKFISNSKITILGGKILYSMFRFLKRI